jgi:hypothetical protein
VVCVQLDAAGNFISETCDRAEVFGVLSPHAAQAASGHNQNRRLSDGRGQRNVPEACQGANSALDSSSAVCSGLSRTR